MQCKNIIPLFVFFSLLSGVSFAQYSISPRLGEIIDQSERQYFNLFPGITNFISAKATERADHQVDITITRSENGNLADTTITISSTLAGNLADYVGSFESARLTQRKVYWEILGGLAWSGPALESKITEGYEATIETRIGEKLRGKLLWADDSLLVLWQSGGIFNWQAVQYSSKIIRFGDIENITIETESKFGTGFAIGAPIGGLAFGAFAVALSNAFSSHINVGAVILVAIIGGAGTGLVGGLIGAILSNNIHRTIEGSVEKYYGALPVLTEHAVFSAYPPPDLLRRIASAPPPQIAQIVQTKGDSLVMRKVASGTLPQNAVHEFHYTVFGELATRFSGMSLSVNYERPLSRSFVLRVGLGFGNGTDNYGSETKGDGWGPMAMVSYLTEGSSKFEFGLGASLILSSESRYSYNNGSTSIEYYEHPWTLYPAITLGYRYQPDDGGVLFRIGLGYTYYEGYPAEISVGYAF